MQSTNLFAIVDNVLAIHGTKRFDPYLALGGAKVALANRQMDSGDEQAWLLIDLCQHAVISGDSNEQCAAGFSNDSRCNHRAVKGWNLCLSCTIEAESGWVRP